MLFTFCSQRSADELEPSVGKTLSFQQNRRIHASNYVINEENVDLYPVIPWQFKLFLGFARLAGIIPKNFDTASESQESKK